MSSFGNTFALILASAVLTGAKQTNIVAQEDIVAVTPTSIDRLNLVRGGRQWRKGINAFIIADKELPYKEKEQARLFRETWAVMPDIEQSKLTLGPRQGDLRAASAPFLANESFAGGNWKWMLYGDDDTVFFLDNVIALLNTLDWRQPYLLSDCLWWPEGGHGAKKHPNREAPRCLPCDYQDSAMMPGDMCTGMTGFMPVQGCPCTPQQVMEGHWKGGQPEFPDGKGILDSDTATFVSRPDNLDSPNVGWWYMIHGGAGAIISRGAMERASSQQVLKYLKELEPQSGDAMLTKAFWHVMNLGPTDPGYGLCRPGIQMFDPGFKGFRARGPEDAGTLDGGNDPLGIIHRLEDSLDGKGRCDEACEDQLRHTISVHIRSRYAEEDMADEYPTKGKGKGKGRGEAKKPPPFQGATYMMRKLATLHRRHSARRKGRGGYMPLWND